MPRRSSWSVIGELVTTFQRAGWVGSAPLLVLLLLAVMVGTHGTQRVSGHHGDRHHPPHRGNRSDRQQHRNYCNPPLPSRRRHSHSSTLCTRTHSCTHHRSTLLLVLLLLVVALLLLVVVLYHFQ